MKTAKVSYCGFFVRYLLTVAFICCFIGIGQIHAQSITVTGIVTSASDGEPLIGASVQVINSSVGTITDFDGNFTIQAEEGSVLLFSYIGFISREMKVTGNRLDVVLQENSEILSEVVVVGYGVQKKKLVTGATSQVKGEEITKMNTTSPLQAMQGQMPGVTITSESGQPGSGMKVNIRGLGTVGNSGPLYLIDGVKGDIANVNPADIESIDVLKDAASAAIYGAQAANGVVLVTTKSGKEGKTKISFDGYYGWQTVAHKTPMLNSHQYMTIMDESNINSGGAPYDWNGMNSIYHTDGSLIDTDWLDQMFADGSITQSYTLGITGGSATSTYAMSAGYLNQEGIVGGADVSNFSRYNFRVNSNHKLFDNLIEVGEQLSFVYSKQKGQDIGNQFYGMTQTLKGAFNTSPLAPVYDANGELNNTGNSDWYMYDGNPYGMMQAFKYNQNKNANLTANVYAQIQPIRNLKLRTVFGVNYATSETRSFTLLYNFSPYIQNVSKTSVSQGMNHGLELTWTNTLSYDWKIQEHEFNALLGMEAYQLSGTHVGAGNAFLKEGFDSWTYAWVNNGTAATTGEGLSASGNPYDKERRVSYFGRFGWNWKEKYMINVTLRNDGSSKFARGHRHGWFPSVSAGWNISNEKFMESTGKWLEYLKIRASYGKVGNQNIDNYRYLSPIQIDHTHYFFGQYMGANGAYNGGYSTILENYWGAYPSRLGNVDLTWESSEQFDAGFDARFLNGRLSANFDFYIKNTKNWLVQAPILATAGTEAPFINGGNVKNTGVELSLGWNDTVGKDFSYNIGINGAYNKNRVGAIPTQDGIIHGETNQLYDNAPEFYRAENGHSIGYFWGYKTAGVFQNQVQIDEWKAAGNGVLQANPVPGDVIFVDVDKNGTIDDNDKVDLGNGTPKFTYGINLNFSYKNFDLGIVGIGQAGNKIVQSYRNQGNSKANYTTAILDRWTGEGTSNKMPRVTNENINWQFSDLYLQDGDFFRISNLTLGYNFAPLINQKWLSNCRFYFQVQNLVTFTKYDGMDPEVGYGTASWVSGVDLGFYPRSRTYLFGVNLSF
ncbi:MAG: TonB-dependent receptor [Bacteroides sp.]|uniref:SusC/RagA family TonB-linked outer membrane protein n=1 Tax=Phocaeicola sartorii TaxID=671267 RepID=UPI001B110E4B|nr:TonB-dependent receptor [Phocaeicola sartorii]MBO5507483.1 TonB-dependent receptor [Bacteroides sp.]